MFVVEFEDINAKGKSVESKVFFNTMDEVNDYLDEMAKKRKNTFKLKGVKEI